MKTESTPPAMSSGVANESRSEDKESMFAASFSQEVKEKHKEMNQTYNPKSALDGTLGRTFSSFGSADHDSAWNKSDVLSKSLPNELDGETKQTETLQSIDPVERLFGSLPSELADSLASQLDEEFSKGIQDLPLLRQESLLKKRLNNAYLENVDLFEAHCHHNFFSLHCSTSKRRREQIIHLYESCETAKDVPILTSKEQEEILQEKQRSFGDDFFRGAALDHSNLSATGKEVQSGNPEGSENEKLREVLTSLRKNICQARQRLQTLKKQLEELENASHTVEYRPNSEVTSSIHESFQTLASIGNRNDDLSLAKLQGLQEQGRAYLEEQQKKKRIRHQEDESDEDVENWLEFTNSKRLQTNQAKTLTERYAKDGIEKDSIGDMRVLHEMSKNMFSGAKRREFG